MKNTKLVLVGLCMVSALAACGGSSNNNNPNDTTGGMTAESKAAGVKADGTCTDQLITDYQGLGTDAQTIQENGKLLDGANVTVDNVKTYREQVVSFKAEVVAFNAKYKGVSCKAAKNDGTTVTLKQSDLDKVPSSLDGSIAKLDKLIKDNGGQAVANVTNATNVGAVAPAPLVTNAGATTNCQAMQKDAKLVADETTQLNDGVAYDMQIQGSTQLNTQGVRSDVARFMNAYNATTCQTGETAASLMAPVNQVLAKIDNETAGNN